MTYSSSHRGYTLLFAVLTASLVLGVAVFILSVSRKQYILSVTARESTYSIYAADSGIECASRVDDLSTSSPESAGTISCNESGTMNIPVFECDLDSEDVSLPDTYEDGSICRSTGLVIPLANYTCAALTFIKAYHSELEVPVTLIESRGYNICTDDEGVYSPDTGSARIVERALRLTQIGI